MYGSEFVYDEKGNRKSSVLPSGITGRNTYDAFNNTLIVQVLNAPRLSS